MEGYCRPLLCRLCGCPVVDGGFQLGEHHLDKLSRWCLAHWDTEFEDVACIVCHFCIWDLRIADQHSEKKEPVDQTWWPKDDGKEYQNYNKYYSDEWMKSCSVKIAPLPKEYRQDTFHCLYCPESYSTHKILVKHVKTAHPDEIIHCNNRKCGMFFHTKAEKEEHFIQAHHRPKKCVYCGEVSANNESINAHMQKYHKNQIIRCKYKSCNKYFKTKEKRDKHFEDAHNAENFICRFCKRRCQNRIGLWHHMQNNHKKALKCNVSKRCPNYFKTEDERQKHISKKHTEKFQCIFCNIKFTQGATLSQHIKKYHGDVALRCKSYLCSTWFKTEEEKQKHYKEKHEIKDDDTLYVPCPFCNKKFSRLGGIHSHYKIHHKKEKLIKCDYKSCANYFRNDEDKLKHIQEVHEIYDEKFRCVYCYKFILKNLNQHITFCHKDVAIKCSFSERCGTYFETLEDRDNHVRKVHQAEKIKENVQCFYCDQVLSSINSLNFHIKLKHSEITIKCKHPQCGTIFKSQEDLEKHFSLKPKHKQNLKKEPIAERFRCALCQKAFHRKSQVKQHIISRHRKSKDVCPHCKKTTSCKREHVVSNFCKVCNQEFQCLALFSSHRKKCKRVYHCPVCAESFKIQSRLIYHCKIKHTVPIINWKGLQFKSKGFKCDECFSYFEMNHRLQNHNMKWHGSDSDALTCDFCKKQFPMMQDLKQHIERVHLGLKKVFQCPVCNKKLDTENVLRKHVQNKCYKNIIQCSMCEKVMAARGLKDHIQRCH